MSWAAIAGEWSFKGRSATYNGSENAPRGVALAADTLRSGRISARVLLGDTRSGIGRILLGYDAESERHFSVGLGGDGGAYTVDAFEPGQNRYESITRKGRASQLANNTWYDIEVRLRGRSVSLRVDRFSSSTSRSPTLQAVLRRAYSHREMVRSGSMTSRSTAALPRRSWS